MRAFAQRVGQYLAAPHLAAPEILTQQKAVSDVTLLLIAKVVCFDTAGITKAVYAGSTAGVMTGVSQLSLLLQRHVVAEIFVVIILGVIISLFAGKSRSLGRDMEFAAAAWVPGFVVKLPAMYYVAFSERPLPELVETVFAAIALAASSALALYYASCLRKQGRAE